jgi:ABC-type sugar transport system ATPase subunit
MRELCRFLDVSCDSRQYQLHHLNTLIFRGELLAVTANNVSTKECFVRLMTRELPPTSGRIEWADPAVPGSPPCLWSVISAERSLFCANLSLAENLIRPDGAGLLYSRKKAEARAAAVLAELELDYPVSRPFGEPNDRDLYLLSIVKAYSLGSRFLILTDYALFTQEAERERLRKLVRILLKKEITVVLLDGLTVFHGEPFSRMLRFENGFLTQTLYGAAEMRLSVRRQTRGAFQIPAQDFSGGALRLECRLSPRQREAVFALRPGEVSYLIAARLQQRQLIENVFGDLPCCRIGLPDGTVLADAQPDALLENGVGYFPQDIRRVLFPNMTFRDNATFLALNAALRARFLIRENVLRCLMDDHASLRGGEPTRQALSSFGYELQFESVVNRYLLYPWKLLILRLPYLTSFQTETAGLRRLIDDLSARRAGILILISSPDEMIFPCHSAWEAQEDGSVVPFPLRPQETEKSP